MKGVQDPPEQQQVEAAQRDPSQFAVLYERHFEHVFAFVARRLPTRQDAEDVTSEVFHQALRNLERFRWQGAPFVSWLLGIANNIIAKRWQQLGRAMSSSQDEAELVEQPASAEQQSWLLELLDRLPEDQRRVLISRFVEQRSIREIAVELSRSEGAIKQLQFRGLEHLRSFVRSS